MAGRAARPTFEAANSTARQAAEERLEMASPLSYAAKIARRAERAVREPPQTGFQPVVSRSGRAGVPARHLDRSERKEWRAGTPEGTPALLV